MLCRYFVLFFRDLVFDLLQELGCLGVCISQFVPELLKKSFPTVQMNLSPRLKSFQWFVHLDDDSLFK